MIQEKSALLIIDMINTFDFQGGENLFENTLKIVDNIRGLKRKAKDSGIPVIYVNDNYGLWQDNMNDIIEHCKKKKGETVIEKIHPDTDDYFIIKPKHSCFFGTQLDILLHQLEVKHLILTGIAGDICVLYTANDAYMREYEISIPKDCMASESDGDNESAIRIIKKTIGADMSLSDQMTF
ncbi:isochorismatase family cysteine hydrolase [Rossellomorea yichunensis]|jgi:nicotinamidase-related amidase|uniref:isochorismatase family cysteine hydrolase n=1 Tax=Rossellomorea yichunensis TaxID=3077331 RepID=UPI0028E018A7|nr:isochorismatase family cysteine hydrolase [Rossellomorea sp. YC4-1]MDT9025270.1 isochorismatase family cysteine hydrolase [Rossellomorea sp. YC4-1]